MRCITVCLADHGALYGREPINDRWGRRNSPGNARCGNNQRARYRRRGPSHRMDIVGRPVGHGWLRSRRYANRWYYGRESVRRSVRFRVRHGRWLGREVGSRVQVARPLWLLQTVNYWANRCGKIFFVDAISKTIGNPTWKQQIRIQSRQNARYLRINLDSKERWKWKSESWFYYRKVLFVGAVGIAETWFYSA